jgi:hypothetical protein
MHGSEEYSEGGKIEVDSVVTPELWPTKPEVVPGTGVFFGAANGSGKLKGTTLVLAHMPTEVMVVFSEAID